MASRVFQTIEDRLNLTCSVCLDSFTDPKLLSCSHIFCQQCLARLVRRNQRQLTLTCPSCRQPTLISNGVESLPPAVHIKQLLEILEEHKADEAANVGKIPFCINHEGKEVDLYCETCGVLVCWKCIKKGSKHHSHDYDELDDAVDKFKKEIDEALHPLENKLKESFSLFQECRDQVIAQQAAIEEDIRSSIRQLHDYLNARQQKLLSQLDGIIQDKFDSLSGQHRSLENIQAEMVELMNESAKGKSHEVLLAKTEKMSHVKKLIAQFQLDTFMPNANLDVKFLKSAEIIAQCQYYGDLQLGEEEAEPHISELKPPTSSWDEDFTMAPLQSDSGGDIYTSKDSSWVEDASLPFGRDRGMFASTLEANESSDNDEDFPFQPRRYKEYPRRGAFGGKRWYRRGHFNNGRTNH